MPLESNNADIMLLIILIKRIKNRKKIEIANRSTDGLRMFPDF